MGIRFFRTAERIRNSILFLSLLFVSTLVFANPQKITFQSKIYNPDGTALEAPSVQFKFSLMNPLGTCVIFSETFSGIDLTGSGGSVVLNLGNGTRDYPVAGGMVWQDAFNNLTTSYTCQSAGTFSPTMADSRRIVMQFNDGGANGWQTLPAMDINTVPYSMFAFDSEQLAGHPLADFVLGSALPTCGGSDVLTFDGSIFTCITPSGGTQASAISPGYLSSADWTTFNNKLSVITSADISVGAVTDAKIASVDWSKVANTPTTVAGYGITDSLTTATTFSGDISGTYNSTQVDKIKNIPLTLTSIASGDILQYNGSAFINKNIPACGVNEYLTFNGSVYTCVSDVGAGGTVGSVNSLTGALNIVTGTGGSDFNISSAATTVTLNIPTASSTVRGALSSSDWTTFNSKLSAITSSDVTTALGYTAANSSDLTNYLPLNGGTISGNLSVAQSLDATKILVGDGTSLNPSITFASDTNTGINLGSPDQMHFVTNGNARFLLNNSSFVGFGTGSPFLTLTGTGPSGPAYSFNTSSTTGMYSPTSHEIAFATNAIERIRIDSTGNVGIGTTSPSYALQVSGDVSISGNFKINGTNISSGTVTGVSGTAPISVATGTTTPVISMTQATGSADGYLSSNDWTTFNNKLSAITSSDVTTALGYTAASSSDLSSNYLKLSGGALTGSLDVAQNNKIQVGDAALSSGAGLMHLSNHSYYNGSSYVTDGIAGAMYQQFGQEHYWHRFTSGGVYTPEMTLNSSGNLGLGTTTPAAKISFQNVTTNSVDGITWHNPAPLSYGIYRSSGDWSAPNYQQLTLSFATGIVIDGGNGFTRSGTIIQPNGGNVGIGTTSPTAKLTISSSDGTASSAPLKLISGTNLTTPEAGAIEYDGTNLYFTDSGVIRRTVATTTGVSSSYVAKAGDTMSGALNITANSASADLSVTQSGAGPAATFMGGGVGIGTTAPFVELHVVGSTMLQRDGLTYASSDISTPAPNAIQNLYSSSNGDSGLIGFDVRNSSGNHQRSYMGAISVPGVGEYASALVFGNSTGANSYTEKMRIDSSGNVGIGTSSPNTWLHLGATLDDVSASLSEPSLLVVGKTTIDATPTSVLTLARHGTSGSIYPAVSEFKLSSNGNGQPRLDITLNGASAMQNIMSLNYNGNVGIGTTSPTAKLTISSSDGTASSAPLKLISGTNLTTPEAGAIEYDGTNLYFTDSGATRRTIASTSVSGSLVSTNAGSVGAPSISFSGDPDTGLYSSGANTLGVAAGGSNIFNFSIAGMVSPTTGGASVTTANGDATAPTFSFAGDTDTGWFRPAANTLAAATGGTESMRINASGDVGIGTATPSAKLNIQNSNANRTSLLVDGIFAGAAGGKGIELKAGAGTGNFSLNVRQSAEGSFAIYDVTNSATRLYLDSSGKFALNNSANSSYDVTLGNTTDKTIGLATIGAGAGGVANGSGSNLTLVAGHGVSASTPDSNGGNLILSGGIPTGAGTSKILFQTGGGGSSALTQTLPSTRMVIEGSGYVGIGTTSPAEKFDVSGSARIFNQTAGGWTTLSVRAGDTQLGGNLAEFKNFAGTTLSNVDANGGFALNNLASTFSILSGTANINIGNAGQTVIGGATDSLGIKSGASILFATGGTTESMRITASGDVGIGTTSPGAKLHIDSSTAIRLSNSTTSSNGLLGGIDFYNTNVEGAAVNSRIHGLRGSAPLTGQVVFETRDGATLSERMRITASGDVGIGTTNPQSQLEISGSTITNGQLRITTPQNVSSGNTLFMRFNDTNGAAAYMGFGGTADLFTIQNYKAGPIVLATNAAERMRIDSSGNVGIGTTSPGYMLDVNGAINATAMTINGVAVGTGGTQWSNGAAGAVYYNGGNIGIGTATPTAGKLQVAGSVSATGALAADIANMTTIDYVGSSYGRIYVNGPDGSTNGSLRFVTVRSDGSNSLTPMMIDSSGKVGIGTTTPQESLEVAGAGRFTSSVYTAPTSGTSLEMYYNSSNDTGTINPYDRTGAAYKALDIYGNPFRIIQSGAEKFRVHTNGYIGVGATTPAALMHLNSANINNRGQLSIESTDYAHMTFYGGATTTTNLGTDFYFDVANGRTVLQGYNGTSTTAANVVINPYGGNVGVGTLTPTHPFHVEADPGANDYTAFIKATRATAGQNNGLLINAGSTAADAGLVVRDKTNANTYLVVDGLGKMGVGTASPEGTLHVSASSASLVLDANTQAADLKKWRFVPSVVAAGDLGFQTMNDNNTVKGTPFYITNAGNVGIGTTAPTAKFNIVDNNDYAGTMHLGKSPYQGKVNFDGGSGLFQFDNTSAGATGTNYYQFKADGTAIMSMLKGGNVGIGMAAPGSQLQVGDFSSSDVGGAQISASMTSGTDAAIAVRKNANAWFTFGTTGTAAKIRSNTTDNVIYMNNSGEVGIGIAGPSYTLDVNGSARATGSVAAWSDIRTKKNIEQIPNALEKILQVRGVTFDWRQDEFPDKKFKKGRDMGVIAQEVEKVFPETVHTAPDSYKSVSYSQLVAPLIEAIKELYAKIVGHDEAIQNQAREIASVKADNAAKDEKIKELEARLEKIEKSLNSK